MGATLIENAGLTRWEAKIRQTWSLRVRNTCLEGLESMGEEVRLRNLSRL